MKTPRDEAPTGCNINLVGYPGELNTKAEENLLPFTCNENQKINFH